MSKSKWQLACCDVNFIGVTLFTAELLRGEGNRVMKGGSSAAGEGGGEGAGR